MSADFSFFFDYLSYHSQIRPDSTFLQKGSVTTTFSESKSAVEKIAAYLSAQDLPAYGRVAIFLSKEVETVHFFLACAHAGLVAVPINPVLKPQQVEHILKDCSASVLVTATGRMDRLRESASIPASVKRVVEIEEKNWLASSETLTPNFRHARLATDPIAILYTSGSTGKPKGVVLSHNNMVWGARSVVQYLEQSAEDCVLSLLPLSFDAGLSQVTTSLLAGNAVILLDYLLARDVCKAIEKYGVTSITAVPPLWSQLSALDWSDVDTRSVRLFAATGGRMSKSLTQSMQQIFPQAKPYLMYGLTEAFRSTYLDPALVEKHPDSIGKAIPFSRVGVFRPDGTECDDGEVGELVHDGPLVSLGYWNNPELTSVRFKPSPFNPSAITLPNQAVWSGDKAFRDEDGLIYFVGRDDEMIKTSGYRVSPVEIEEVVLEFRAVQEAVALGIEHAQLGQAIVLVLVGTSSEESGLRQHLRDHLANYMQPVDVLWMQALPRNPNGKIDRSELRQLVQSQSLKEGSTA